ncbi:isochorismatase domain-containing protein 2-like [Protopterus annectens]|uniref:isochorismatase domain-containing protein 2-like n=1 Tax=Protopterus annectens TaxID=7888 RepID=UPI001CFB2959|nr:isochorismatase domain-containing protein 2-like [Protopterus annectens]
MFLFQCAAPKKKYRHHRPKRMAVRHLGRISQKTSVLFLCDMQEKFRPNIAYFPQIVSVAATLLKAAKALQIPMIVTEQYPKGLGPTVPELGAKGLKIFSKTCFTMLTPEVEEEMRSIPDLHSVILCGIEAQACIMQINDMHALINENKIIKPADKGGAVLVMNASYYNEKVHCRWAGQLILFSHDASSERVQESYSTIAVNCTIDQKSIV